MEVYPYFAVAPKLLEAAQRAEELAEPQFRQIEENQRYNQQKMLAAFNRAGVSESHFVGSTGYGYGDRGREVLDQVYAYAFGAEVPLVPSQFCQRHPHLDGGPVWNASSWRQNALCYGDAL